MAIDVFGGAGCNLVQAVEIAKEADDESEK
jgi:hypothetical protein